MSENHIGNINEMLREAAAEIKRLREERVEYRQTWLEWLEANDSLTIEQWLLAYSDATPEPTESEDDETICGYIDRRMRAAAAEIKRLREDRDEARREGCDLEITSGKDAGGFWDPEAHTRKAKVCATSRGWDCFKEKTP